MNDELDKLRPEVREAVRKMDFADLTLPEYREYVTVRADLLRLPLVEAELAESRETIKRLNRRVQVAEAAVAEKVKASASGSLGRALANAAASKAEAELEALKTRIARAPWTEAGYLQCMPPHTIVDSRGRVKRWHELDAVRLLIEK